MARQKGIIPLQGTIGNINFFKSGDGYMAREKGGVSADKIANDPVFERTRENNAEFGRAGKASKVLRTAFRPLLQKASDNRMISRLLTKMLEVIHEDGVNLRGQRNVIDGEATMLEGFEFNINSRLSAVFHANYTITLTRATGVLSVNIPAFVPAERIAAPQGTTHVRLSLGGSDIDFENEIVSAENVQTDFIAWNNQMVTLPDLTVNLPAASTHPLFGLLSIEFLQDVNGAKYPLKNGKFNASSLIKVDNQ